MALGPLTPRSVFRYFKVDGVPSSGKHEPIKAEIIQLLETLFGTSRGGWVVTRTLEELIGVVPEDETDGGVVLADPDPANNGFYERSEGEWVKGRGFPDTFARVELSGDSTMQVGEVRAGVNPADIEVFFAFVETENTGPLTLAIGGDALREVVNLAGNPLSAGEWTGAVMFALRDGKYQLLLDAGAAQAAALEADRASDEADRAEREADRSDAAADRAQNAASAVTSRAWFDYVSTLLADDNDVIGYVGSGADFEVAAGDIIEAQGFRYEVAASDATDAHVETAGGVRLLYLYIGRINVQALGAIAVNSSIYSETNRVAFQKAFDILSSIGGAIYIPGGYYRISDQIDCFIPNSPRFEIEVFGDGQHVTRVQSDFYGAGKALFRIVDPNSTTRASPICFYDMQVGSVTRAGGVNPVYIDIAGWGEGRIDRVKFGPSNNTVLRGGGIQNLRGNDLVSYYGGKFYNWKSTQGITFSLSGNSLTASASIFTSDDVGLTIVLDYTGGRRRFTISTVTDGMNATVETSNFRLGDVSNVAGWFEGAVGNITAGNNLFFTVTGMNTFTPDDVGRTILIQGARGGTNGASNRAVLRAKIIEYVQPHAVRIGDELGNPINAQRTVGKARFATPLFDFYQPRTGGTLGAGSSDVQLAQLHIEHYFGVAVFCENVGEWVLDGKIHGETVPNAQGTNLSGECFWLNDAGFEFSGVMDSSCGFSRSRVYVADQNKTAKFLNIFNRNMVNDRFLFLEPFSDAGGYVEVNGIEMANYASSEAGWITDNNVPSRAVVLGYVNMLGDIQPAEAHVGYGIFTNKVGELTLSRSADVRIITGAGTPEGVVTAGKGSLFLRIDGSAALVAYAKSTASGNTGWKAITQAA